MGDGIRGLNFDLGEPTSKLFGSGPVRTRSNTEADEDFDRKRFKVPSKRRHSTYRSKSRAAPKKRRRRKKSDFGEKKHRRRRRKGGFKRRGGEVCKPKRRRRRKATRRRHRRKGGRKRGRQKKMSFNKGTSNITIKIGI